MSVMNDKFHYECTDCGAAYDAGSVMYLCPACEKENVKDQPIKGVLRTVYDFSRILKKFRADNVYDQLSKENFLSLLPLRNEDCLPRLKIGNTPLYRIDPEVLEQPDQIEKTLETTIASSVRITGENRENHWISICFLKMILKIRRFHLRTGLRRLFQPGRKNTEYRPSWLPQPETPALP